MVRRQRPAQESESTQPSPIVSRSKIEVPMGPMGPMGSGNNRETRMEETRMEHCAWTVLKDVDACLTPKEIIKAPLAAWSVAL